MSLAPRPGSTGPTITLSWRNFYSVLIALLPVVMMYNVPVVNIGLATVLVGVTAPFAILAIIRYRILNPAIISIIFFGYLILRSVGSNKTIILLFLVMLHVLGAFNNSLDIGTMRKTVEFIAILGTAVLLVQYLVFYLLGIRFTILIKSFVLEANQNAVSDLYNSRGLFRPAALFLEPSHYSQYCCVALLSSLFPHANKEIYWIKVIWIALGIILTTSGQGIVLVACIFAWYAIFHQVKQGTKIKTIFLWTVVGLIVFVILMRFPFFRTAVNRFTNDSGTTENAIKGRTLYFDVTVGSLSGLKLLIGVGSVELPENYMTGLMSLVYCYGILGYALYVLTFALLALSGKNNFTICLCVVFCGLSTISNNSGFISLIYEFSITIASISQINLISKSNFVNRIRI